jgi:hypothetical protein
MSWLPTKLPPHCKIIVSCTKEENNPQLCQDYELLTKMIEDKQNFLEVSWVGKSCFELEIRELGQIYK